MNIFIVTNVLVTINQECFWPLHQSVAVIWKWKQKSLGSACVCYLQCRLHSWWKS